MKERQIIEELDLLAYVDGLLDGDSIAKARVEERLRACPDLAERVRAYTDQTEALRRAYGGHIREPVPDRLLATLERRPQHRFRNVAAAAVIVLATLAASGAGWLLGQSSHSHESATEEFVNLSYRDFVSSASDPRAVSNGKHEPVTWLFEEISLSLRIPDLSNLGYSLIDKQTVREADNQMVRLTYAASDGRSFSLFLRPRWGERKRALEVATERDVSIAYWLDGPLASAVASRMPPEETMAIAKTVQGALLDLNVAEPAIRSGPSGPQGANLTSDVTAPGRDGRQHKNQTAPMIPMQEGAGVLPN